MKHADKTRVIHRLVPKTDLCGGHISFFVSWLSGVAKLNFMVNFTLWKLIKQTLIRRARSGSYNNFINIFLLWRNGKDLLWVQNASRLRPYLDFWTCSAQKLLKFHWRDVSIMHFCRCFDQILNFLRILISWQINFVLLLYRIMRVTNEACVYGAKKFVAFIVLCHVDAWVAVLVQVCVVVQFWGR